jgi:hypothetical protein
MRDDLAKECYGGGVGLTRRSSGPAGAYLVRARRWRRVAHFVVRLHDTWSERLKVISSAHLGW